MVFSYDDSKSLTVDKGRTTVESQGIKTKTIVNLDSKKKKTLKEIKQKLKESEKEIKKRFNAERKAGESNEAYETSFKCRKEILKAAVDGDHIQLYDYFICYDMDKQAEVINDLEQLKNMVYMMILTLLMANTLILSAKVQPPACMPER